MFNSIPGVRLSSPAISSQHLLGQAQAYKAMGNLEKAKECYEGAVEKAKAEHEKRPSHLQAKEAYDAIRNEFFIFLSGLEEPGTAIHPEGQSYTSSSPNRSGNDAATHRPLSAQRAQDAVLALSNGIKPAFFEKCSSSDQEKSRLVDYLFEKSLSTLGSLEASNKPSLFLVYAHDNPAYGKADAYTAKYLIKKLSQIRVNLYSDQTPMGQTYLSSPEEQKEDSKLEDILTNQLRLLPTSLRNDVKPADKVVVCCSEVLGNHLKWPYYEDFYRELREAYHEDCKRAGTSVIRGVIKKFSQEKKYSTGFRHVLTEIAFLQIRAEQCKDQHGIIPVSLTPNSYQHCLAHFISAMTVRMEDIPRLEAQAETGEVFPNQSRHLVVFKLIERLLVSNNEAKTFLDRFWQGYSECIARLKDQPSTLSGLEFVKLIDDIFGDIQRTLHNELALTVQQQHQQLKHQQEIELRLKREPLSILGENIEEEYFTAWEERGEIQDGLAMYVAPHATAVTNRNITFNLDEAVTTFLKQKNDSIQKVQVLLLRGEAGSGKSTFNRQLARRLWREYGEVSASNECPIPLYISLPTIDKPNKNLIGQYLSDKCGFSPEQIEALRESQRLILILDGYDEIAPELRNLYADKKLDDWQAKIIVSSRPEYLSEGYQNNLQPRGYSRSLLEYQLEPFSKKLIAVYIDQYVKHTGAKWSVQEYQDALTRIPNVKELLGTPFLLKMALDVLPTLGDVTLGLTRIKLYERFVQSWFDRSLARLDAIRSKLTDTEQKAFRSLEEEFVGHSQAFNTDFALAMYEAKTTVAEYSAISRRGVSQDKRYEAFLSNKDEEKNLLRFSALLTRQNQQYRFIHKSIQDYLVARAVWEELENSIEFDPSADPEPLNGTKNVRLLWEKLSPSIQINPAAWLNKFNLVDDLAIQCFLVERVQCEKALVKPLLAWVKASATENTVSQAAANAITILVKAGVQFNGVDLRGIKIPEADLSHGVFDSTQLQEADLRNVNLRKVWLRNANLNGAQMAGVKFSELRHLQEKNQVNTCVYSPDGRFFAVGFKSAAIHVYGIPELQKIHTLSGHTDSVSSVTYSSNSQQIASSSDDKTVRLWDAQTGQLRHTLSGHTDSVWSVRYSPNGQQIASGSEDKTVRLWDMRTGQLSHTLSGHTDSVLSVTYSPSGEQIASGSYDKTVRLWDAQTGQLSHTLSGHTWFVSSVTYSPNGWQIASGSYDKTVRLWDVQSGALGHILKGHTGYVLSVVYSPSGEQIASGSNDKTLRLWNAQSGAPSLTLQGHTHSVVSVVYSPNGEQIASGSGDNTVRLWDVQTAQLSHTLSGHTESVLNVKSASNDQQIASGRDGQTVWLWNTQTNLSHTLDGHTDSVLSLKYSLKSQQIASCSDDQTVRLWDATTGQLRHTLRGHTDSVWSVKYSPNGGQIASGSDDHTIRLWDAQTGQLRRTLRGHTWHVRSVKYSPDGRQIASGSGDHTVRLWDAQTGQLSHTLSGHTSSVRNVKYSPDSQQVASGSWDKTVRLWDAQTGQLSHTLSGHTDFVRDVKYSSNGEQLASGSDDKTVRLWDPQTGKLSHTLKGHTGFVLSLTYAPNDRQLASGSYDKTVRLWDTQTGQLDRTLNGHADYVSSVKYAPNGEQIVSASKDQTVKLWDIKTGQCQRTIKDFDGPVTKVVWKAISGDNYLVTGSADKSVRLWRVIKEGGQYQVRLCWSSAHEILTVEGTSIEGARGLVGTHEQLLKQCGAVGEPLREAG